MVSVLRNLQAEWNSLVPRAQAQGIPRVRMLNGPLETIQYRRDKLNWLKSLLSSATDVSALSFGVELECLMPTGVTKENIAVRIRDLGVECEVEVYNHNTTAKWKIVTDGSLGDYTRGIEIVSPVLYGDAGLEAVAKVASVLKSAGCKITKRCGFHVHVGARNEGVDFFRNLAKLYASAEPVIDTFMAPSRRGNTNNYAQSVVHNNTIDSATTLIDVARSMGQSNYSIRGAGRYKKLNFQSFWQHGTVEFRHHQGTVDAEKIKNWIRFCLLMCTAAKGGKSSARTMDELMDAIQASETERRYFKSRVTHFNRAIPRSSAFEAAGADLSTRSRSRGPI